MSSFLRRLRGTQQPTLPFREEDIAAVTQLIRLYNNAVVARNTEVIEPRSGDQGFEFNRLTKFSVPGYGNTYSIAAQTGPNGELFVYTLYQIPGAVRIFRISPDKQKDGVLYIGELLSFNTEPKLVKDVEPFLDQLRVWAKKKQSVTYTDIPRAPDNQQRVVNTYVSDGSSDTMPDNMYPTVVLGDDQYAQLFVPPEPRYVKGPLVSKAGVEMRWVSDNIPGVRFFVASALGEEWDFDI